MVVHEVHKEAAAGEEVLHRHVPLIQEHRERCVGGYEDGDSRRLTHRDIGHSCPIERLLERRELVIVEHVIDRAERCANCAQYIKYNDSIESLSAGQVGGMTISRVKNMDSRK